MIRTMLTAAAALSLFVGTAVGAAPCRDAKGHFTKCTAVKTTTKTTTVTKSAHCRDAKGHFAKCGTPGAHAA
jgi:hypothetical protein